MEIVDNNHEPEKGAKDVGEHQPSDPPDRAESSGEKASPGEPTDTAVALSASFATRLWLDHFTSHRIPTAPRAGPRFDSAGAAVEKMLKDEAEIVPLSMSPVQMPSISADSDPRPVWVDELPSIPAEVERHLAQVVTDSPKERNAVPPLLQALIAADPAGFADAAGLPFATFVASLGD